MERRQQQWGLKTFLILCVCVFCVYEIQDVALENMDKYQHQISPAPKPILSVMDIHSLSDQGAHHDVSHITDDIHQEQRAAQVWITMALCWSANAQVHGKENFPYKDAAPLSSQLWMNITPAKVCTTLKSFAFIKNGTLALTYFMIAGYHANCIF